MSADDVEPAAQRDIDRLVRRLLRESGFREPPVDIETVLQTLQLDREFYDLGDPGLLKQLRHRTMVGAKLLADYLEKIKLRALLLFDDKRVLLDSDLPEKKHDWATAHEAGHELIPWHRQFCRGDTLETLDPSWHEQLEAEANYAASGLLFCGDAFRSEALDTPPGWETIQKLARRYRKNLHLTVRRYVEHGPAVPMILLVSTPHWKEPPGDQATRVRHLVLSPTFEAQLGALDPEDLRKQVDRETVRRRGGVVGEFECHLRDRAGDIHVFHAGCFFNQYYVMSLFVHQGTAASRVAVPNRQ